MYYDAKGKMGRLVVLVLNGQLLANFTNDAILANQTALSHHPPKR